MGVMQNGQAQVVTGVVPPEMGEAIIRTAWPSVARFGAVASLGRALTNTIILAPLAWLIMAPFYFSKVLFVVGRRYVLTNQRLMIQHGMTHKPAESISLKEIDEVRVVEDGNSAFFRAATLEIGSNGQVKLRLPGMPAPEAFRHAILNACCAWVPEKAKVFQKFIPASSGK